MSHQPPAQPPERFRHRIEEIKLEPATSTYPITAKVLVDDKMAHRLPKIARGQPLLWHDVPPWQVDVVLTTRISIRLYEQHTWSRPHIGSVEYIISAVGDQHETTLACDTGKFTIKLEFATPEPDEDVATKMLDKAQKADRQQRLLEKLGPTRNAIKTILDLGTAVAELHPAAKMALGICNQAWAKLEAQEQCDASVESLIDGLASIMPYVEAVKVAAKLPQLQRTVASLIHLIEDASRFIIEYKFDGGAVQTLKVLTGSTAQEQVDNLVKKFGALAGEFDRGVNVQTYQTVDMSANRMLLNDLKPVGQAKYDPDRACMPGTREELIKEVLDWCKRPNLPDQPATGRLLWVHGHAGLGKSAIATSVCQALDDEKLLAASFFCKRDDPERRDPQRSLTSLVHSLAVRNSSYGNEVAKALQEDISLCRSPMQTQYDKLVRDVLGSPALAYSSDCLVIVVDALDECGDQSTRRRLLTYLLRMSQLVTWLRVVVTSRPDKDIEETFDQTDAVVFSSLDVHQHNASKDIHTFIHTRLANSKNARLLPEDTGDRLTEHADGLFIWAQTACQFILSSHSPRDRLRAILAADDRSGQSTGALDSLYATAIKASMGDGGEDDARRVRQCLGAIIVCSTRMPLSVVALSALLGERVELDVMQSVVDSLGSVLYTDHSQGDTVRVYHPSFADYMTTPARSGVHCVDLQEQNTVLAVSCMQTMKVELRFNICRLETSYLRNRDVPNLAARVEASVSRQLEYSCLYWTSHLVQAEKGPETTPGGTLSELVTGPEMLYWIEVLSLANKLHTWSAGMQHLKDWCMETALYDYVKDIDRFVQTFYDPITESAPHLYISGLAFLPVNSTLTRLQHKFFPRTITITRGRELTWPNSLRCISHESAVKCVVVSPNGHRIVSGSGCNLQIWDANTGVAIGDALVGHSKPVASVVFSPNGRLIASGSDDGTVRLWDVETGTPLGNPLTGHSGGVRSIAFSPDGHHIASGSGDKTLQVWNVNEGLTVARWPTGHSEALSSVAFSPDSRYIISASWDGTLQMWGANTGMVICNPLALHEDPILSVAFSPDGRHILSGSWDKSLRIWDTATRAAVGSPFIGHSERVYSAAFSPDGHLVVSGSKDKTVRLWNAGTGTTAGNPLIGHSSDVTSVAFFPDGRRVVSGSRDKTVRVWDIDTIDAATTLPDGHTDWVNSVAFSPHSRSIASGSSDMTVRIWDAATGVPIGKPLVGHSGKVTCVAFSPDGRRVASSSRDTTVRIWDADTGATVVGPMVEHSRPVNSLAFSPDGYRVVSGSWDGTLRLWDANTGVATSNPLVEQTYSIWSVSFSPCGRLIISGLDDNTIRVWDASTGTAVGAPLVGHSGSVLSVSFSPNGRRIASGSEDGTVRVWDAGTGAPVGGPFVGHSEQVTSVAFSPDNSYIVSGSWDTSVQVWDASTGTTVGDPLVGHSNLVCSVAFSPDGSRIVSGSTDNIIRVWDVDTVSAVKQLPWDGTTKSLNRAASLSQSPATNLSWLAEHCTPSGWVLSEQKEPLFWAPAEYRRSSRDDSLFIISSDLTQQRPVWLDFSKFVHGTEWATVFAPSEEL